LRIAIDASNLRQGGGRTHLIELLHEAEPSRDHFNELVVFGSRETLDAIKDKLWIKKLDVPALSKGILSRIFWQRFALGNAIRKENCQILLAPGGSIVTDFRPVVTMSRNMLPFEWRELFRYRVSMLTLKLLILRFLQSWSFHKANGVIFLTEYAKKSILSITGNLKGLSAVIPHGLNPRFLVSEPNSVGIIKENVGKSIRLIYVSIIDQYKHQWHVVEAIAKARQQSGLNLHLDFVGPAYLPAKRKLDAAIAKYDPHGIWVNYYGTVDYTELHSLYAQAHIGIFASTCENMPNILLETMGAGLPILCSNRGPMPEILGDAGVYFDPEQPETLCNALLELLHSEKKMQHLAQAAYERAKDFSWEQCAIATFSFLRETYTRYRMQGHLN
jgi:glycosyltransferase involved in cell wall biosynthesis